MKQVLWGENLGQGKSDYGVGGPFYPLSLAHKIKKCSSIKEYGILSETKTVKCFEESDSAFHIKKF